MTVVNSSSPRRTGATTLKSFAAPRQQLRHCRHQALKLDRIRYTGLADFDDCLTDYFEIATVDQLHQFLRHRLRAAIVALLRHRSAKTRLPSLLLIERPTGCLCLALRCVLGFRGASRFGLRHASDGGSNSILLS